ncbi:DUF2520 domain-containing protein [Baekduia soli]|uniref:DUF2520 domain-containing protein n=1 Tax=Baekduia soli TaxID=496014 RepID=A0A5B8U976_9ACTN|nr:DUF2520 domain-containing protein [Baekduia soli]QEC49709.1 DUF2520 domain-containing protein [Baekduia soli]
MRVLVLGRGRVGRSLAAALQEAGIAHDLAPGAEPPAPALTAAADVVVVAVPDQALPAVAAGLTGTPLPEGGGVVHASGALGLGVLAPAGTVVGSFHPLQPFPEVRGAEAFRGATVAIDATTPALLARLEALAVAIGARPRHVPDEQRTLYHAAAVLASGCVVALAARAQRVLEGLGWPADDALAALLPLMDGTVENLRVQGLPAALSGPLRRGDDATVARHVAALGDAGDALGRDTYITLGRTAVQLAGELGIDPTALARVTDGLDAAVAR